MYSKKRVAQSLTAYIKNYPNKFEECITNIVKNFISRLDIDMPNEEIGKIEILYKITIGYCLITSDLNKYPILIEDSNILNVVTDTLVNNKFSFKINRKLVIYLKKLINELKVTYEFDSSNSTEKLILYIHLAKLHFNYSMYYQAICIVHENFLIEAKAQENTEL